MNAYEPRPHLFVDGKLSSKWRMVILHELTVLRRLQTNAGDVYGAAIL